jgi:anthranilate synthase component 1/para-aminobenzoate synthetase
VPTAPVVIGEGVGAGVRQARARLDLLVWVHAAGPLRRQRALARDGDAFAAWWDAWAAQEDGLLAADPIDRHAHVVVDASAPDPHRWRATTPDPAGEDPRG